MGIIPPQNIFGLIYFLIILMALSKKTLEHLLVIFFFIVQFYLISVVSVIYSEIPTVPRSQNITFILERLIQDATEKISQVCL